MIGGPLACKGRAGAGQALADPQAEPDAPALVLPPRFDMPRTVERGNGLPRRAAKPSRASARVGRHGVRKWSASVTQKSNALDLDPGVFRLGSPVSVALSLKRSADRSKRRKAEPFRSAMSMLIFYINRAGQNLPAKQRRVLESAKQELRRLYHRAS